MKKRPYGFISEKYISHDSEQFDYIRELHEYLWRFVRVAYPSANGSVRDYVDKAIEKLENNELVEYIKLLKNELSPDGDYSIGRADKEPMSLFEVLALDTIMYKIDKLIGE